MSRRQNPIRVLVVDDSAFVRQALSRMLGSEPDIQVVGLAVDGQDGVEKAAALAARRRDPRHPDATDGGLEALKRIMAERPVPVLLLSSLTKEGAGVTLHGLELGAMDFVDKSRVQGNMNLLDPRRGAEGEDPGPGLVARSPTRPPPSPPVVRTEAPRREAHCDIVVIGTSTGGPPALQAIIPRFPGTSAPPFSWCSTCPWGSRSPWPSASTPAARCPCSEARDGETVEPGRVLIAPAGPT